MRADLLHAGGAEPTIGMVERLLILKTFPAFSALAPAELAAMASVCRERFFPKGTVIHKPGAPVVAFHLLIDGEVQVYRDERPTRVFGPRSTVGGLASLTRDPDGTHAVALSDTLALEIDTDDMQDVFEDNFRVLLGVLSAMADTLRSLQQRGGGGAAIDTREEHPDIARPSPLTLVDRMFLLRRTLFGSGSIEALARIAENAIEARYTAGDTIWPIASVAEYSMLVVSGTVRCLPPDAPSFALGAGFVVGGLDALAGSERWYVAMAETDALVLRLERTHLYDVLEDHVDVAMAFLRSLAGGVTALSARLASDDVGEDRAATVR